MVALTDNDNIWIAASDGRISDVQRYLQTQSANTQDENGYSPLAAASSYGHHSLIELLIKEYQADINIIDQEGDTPLHVALDLKTVQLLMELGANPHLRNNESHLPIENAFIQQQLDIVEYLKEFTPDFVEYEGEEDEESQMERLQYLLNDPEQLTEDQQSELAGYLIESGMVQVVQDDSDSD